MGNREALRDVVENYPLTDIRSLAAEEQPLLDRKGYQILHSPFSKFRDLGLPSIEGIKGDELKRRAIRTYLSAITETLRDHYDSTKAVRKATNQAYDKTPSIPLNDLPKEGIEVREQPISTAFNVHRDGSPNNFKRQLLYLLDPEEQLELAEKRVRLRLINMWRPVVDVETGPLALCDTRTVAEDDWEPVDKVFDDWVEESMYLKHNPSQKWYWLSNQTTDEVTTFVVWDSERPNDKNAAVAHCSFKLPDHLLGKVLRESIEMRVLLWTEPSEPPPAEE
ncbi:hypothetical protein C8A00DRAFT_30963 [Chaetomidium leptoderma]|uniref:Uncharacterized protein n=1 Tax=Chaetomidium leptoderma TaxID=669021 RepID=A0AAN6VTX4_9PEZI|nr:hypothetical protein C8A00DRAFT_30963 [Chaetomidium leptoderma]